MQRCIAGIDVVADFFDEAGGRCLTSCTLGKTRGRQRGRCVEQVGKQRVIASDNGVDQLPQRLGRRLHRRDSTQAA